MQVVTNNKPRELVSICAMPLKARADFDYIWPREDMTDEEKQECDAAYDARFFAYRGAWYDVQEFERVSPGMRKQFAANQLRAKVCHAWDGIQSDTFFSATLVRYASRDGETIIVGRCYS